MEITLEQLLKSRDARWETEKHLLETFPGKVLVVLTVVMPGSVKLDERAIVIGHAGEAAINAFLGRKVLMTRISKTPTGFEGYWVTGGDALTIKQMMCGIEEAHPLGRLFDIDVLRPDATPISRTEVGLSARRCLICGNEARWCMRNHTHTQEEIQQHITEMVNDFNSQN